MENVIVYSAAHGGLPVSQVASKARQLLLSTGVARTGGRGALSAQPLDGARVNASIFHFPAGNDREAANLVLTDAAAMCAFAPYRATIVAAENPFRHAVDLANVLTVDVEIVRIRIHDAFCNATRIVSLGRDVAASLQPFLPGKQRAFEFPAVPLIPGGAEKQILTVIHPGSEELGAAVLAALNSDLPEWEFVVDRTDVFANPWHAAIHVGPATSLEPGSRLPDCWAGGVPVFQIARRSAQRVRAPDRSLPLFVTEGRTGHLCGTVEALLSALRDFAAEPRAAPDASLAAQNETDWLAAWSRIASEILQ